MNSSQKAWIGGLSVFVGTYVGLSIIGSLFPTDVFTSFLILLLCLFLSTYVMDTIDPVTE